MSRSSPTSSAPSPTSRRNASSASASLNNTPTKPAPIPRGPTPAALETTYHKRLRTILVEHKRLRKEWNELVLRGCVGRCRALIEGWIEVENGIQQLDKGKESLGAFDDRSSEDSAKNIGVRAGYLLAQSEKMGEQISLLVKLVAALAEILNAFNQLTERAEMLVIEAAKTRGTAFAFREPLWVTWHLNRFADALQDLTAPYTPSFVLIQTLIDTLTTFPTLPAQLTQLPSLSQRAALALPPSSGDTLLSSVASSAPLAKVSSPSSNATVSKSAPPATKRPSAETLQACISLLAVQPLLPGKSMTGGSEYWEEVCSTEVGGWNS